MVKTLVRYDIHRIIVDNYMHCSLKNFAGNSKNYYHSYRVIGTGSTILCWGDRVFMTIFDNMALSISDHKINIILSPSVMSNAYSHSG